MNSQDKHITPWSASDVQKYLKGELSAREMHQLEKAALEDPFLADAIEGLSQRPAAPLAADIGELQSRLDARVTRKKKSFGWMKMAAAIVLLIGLGYTAWYMLIDKPGSGTAKSAIKPTVPAANEPGPQTSPAAEPSVANITPPADSTSIDIGSAFVTTRKTQTPIRTHKTIEPIERAYADKAKTSKTEVDSMLENKVASLDITPSPAYRMVLDSAAYKKQMFQGVIAPERQAKMEDDRAQFNKNPGAAWQNQNVVYNGQVLDLNNRPLAGAYLQVSGPSNANTTTNALGQFKLNLRPQDTSKQLTVALIGYQNASLAVNTLNSEDAIGNTIFLKESPNTLNEVVVTRRGRSEAFAAVPFEDKTEKLDSFWVKVAPVSGRLTYLDYLSTAKKTLGLDTTIRGAEVISFGIDRKGTPIDFKIEHSLSPAHDAGVIRLIIEGARWKIIHGKNVRAMVNVSFP